jgi:hypothetical protein
MVGTSTIDLTDAEYGVPRLLVYPMAANSRQFLNARPRSGSPRDFFAL